MAGERSKNGKGNSSLISISFTDEDERAKAMADQLAAQRDLSVVVKGMLHALADLQDKTGKRINGGTVMGMFMSGNFAAQHSGLTLVTPGDTIELDTPPVLLSSAETASATEIGKAFSSGTSGLLDDDEDLWD